MIPVILLPDARDEMFEAAVYYESKASGLGVDFITEAESAVLSISKAPATWPVIEGKMRRYLLKRFPFGILYFAETEKIVIVAVAHLRRRPGYWKERL